MKPILKYRGGKSGELSSFKKYIPKYDRYIEPFFGGGALFFDLEPEKAIVNDINTALIRFYKDASMNFERMKYELKFLEELYQKNRVEFEIRKQSTPDHQVKDNNEELYYLVRDMFNNKVRSEYLFGTLYYFINKTAYSGMVRYNSKGEFNVPYGRYKNFNTDLLTKEHNELLKTTKIKNESYIEMFNLTESSDFIFLDPPYDTVFSSYGNEVSVGDFGEKEHRDLAQNFKNLSCNALMVISETSLITELYDGFIVDKYPKKYAVNIRNRFSSEANHLVITNYKIGE